MARVKGAMMTRKRRNATLKLAKGYWGSKSRHFKMAKQQGSISSLARHHCAFNSCHFSILLTFLICTGSFP